MADTILQGRDWGNATHWTDIVPITGDNAFIQAGMDQVVDAGLANAGVDLALFRIHEGYKRNVGASGAALEIAASLVQHYGSGNLYFTCDGDGTANLETDKIVLWPGTRMDGSRPVTELNCQDSGKLNKIFAATGILRVLAGVDWNAAAALHIGMEDGSAQGVDFDIADTVDALPLLMLSSGQGICRAPVTTAVVGGGTRLTQRSKAITTLYIMPGAHVVYEVATLTTVYVGAKATLDLITGDTIKKTITNFTAHPSAIVKFDEGLHTFTNSDDERRRIA